MIPGSSRTTHAVRRSPFLERCRPSLGCGQTPCRLRYPIRAFPDQRRCCDPRRDWRRARDGRAVGADPPDRKSQPRETRKSKDEGRLFRYGRTAHACCVGPRPVQVRAVGSSPATLPRNHRPLRSHRHSIREEAAATRHPPSSPFPSSPRPSSSSGAKRQPHPSVYLAGLSFHPMLRRAVQSRKQNARMLVTCETDSAQPPLV